MLGKKQPLRHAGGFQRLMNGSFGRQRDIGGSGQARRELGWLRARRVSIYGETFTNWEEFQKTGRWPEGSPEAVRQGQP
jgi:hypothetical protein